ncbi:MAG: KaiA family protein [Nostocales cyanobacterium]|nr:MAG: KaiA family protein [Nostocales cyanobacterium]TAF12659.1 MAG: KaiA family protein [Nostocales cyanobacterium]
MILPVLLICPLSPPQIQKYLHNTDAVKKLQGLTVQIQSFIFQTYYQLCNSWQPKLITLNIHHDSSGKYDNNKYIIHHDQNFQVLACHEQKDPQWFQEMSLAKKQETLQQLKSEYREILIDYFVADETLKTKIDKFINKLFYANIPVLQIIEIHMELIDEFSKQLKLEGRSDETILDYRLTLIDVLANLCEIYRGSISKKN